MYGNQTTVATDAFGDREMIRRDPYGNTTEVVQDAFGNREVIRQDAWGNTNVQYQNNGW